MTRLFYDIKIQFCSFRHINARVINSSLVYRIRQSSGYPSACPCHTYSPRGPGIDRSALYIATFTKELAIRWDEHRQKSVERTYAHLRRLIWVTTLRLIWTTATLSHDKKSVIRWGGSRPKCYKFNGFRNHANLRRPRSAILLVASVGCLARFQ